MCTKLSFCQSFIFRLKINLEFTIKQNSECEGSACVMVAPVEGVGAGDHGVVPKPAWAHTPCSKPIRSEKEGRNKFQETKIHRPTSSLPVDGVAVEPVEGLDGLCVAVREGSRQADTDQAGEQSLSMKYEIETFCGDSSDHHDVNCDKCLLW